LWPIAASKVAARGKGNAMPQKMRSRPDVHNGVTPAEMPTYFLTEAAHYLRLSVPTIRAWVLARESTTGAGRNHSTPLIPAADPQGRLLSFLNLVELHVLSSLRRIPPVKPKAVRRTIQHLRRKFHSSHPLRDRQVLTEGKSPFLEQYAAVVSIPAQEQVEMQAILDTYLKRIEWDEEGNPIRLYPFTRLRYKTAPPFVVIDPRIRSGQPCIAGTGVPTSIIAERHEAGDSIAQLAKDYGRSTEEIEEALRYESRAASRTNHVLR
jgi:uncharacterized protein (DUF433 family)